ncbi:MAG TPA: hypothetical protein VNS34_21415, partial [Rhizobiaceae bacterium]|nr:hypothetical protein [Rhizobiaceae bacterium]
NTPANALYHVLAAAIFAEEGGSKADVERERAWLLEQQPALVANIRQEALWRFGSAADAELVLASLRKAGLEVPD